MSFWLPLSLFAIVDCFSPLITMKNCVIPFWVVFLISGLKDTSPFDDDADGCDCGGVCGGGGVVFVVVAVFGCGGGSQRTLFPSIPPLPFRRCDRYMGWSGELDVAQRTRRLELIMVNYRFFHSDSTVATSTPRSARRHLLLLLFHFPSPSLPALLPHSLSRLLSYCPSFFLIRVSVLLPVLPIPRSFSVDTAYAPIPDSFYVTSCAHSALNKFVIVINSEASALIEHHIHSF